MLICKHHFLSSWPLCNSKHVYLNKLFHVMVIILWITWDFVALCIHSQELSPINWIKFHDNNYVLMCVRTQILLNPDGIHLLIMRFSLDI